MPKFALVLLLCIQPKHHDETPTSYFPGVQSNNIFPLQHASSEWRNAAKTHQVLRCTNEGCANAALVQVFGITKVDDFALYLQAERTKILLLPVSETRFFVFLNNNLPQTVPDLSAQVSLVRSDGLQHDVFRLQVPVYYFVRVKILHARPHIVQNASHHEFRQTWAVLRLIYDLKKSSNIDSTSAVALSQSKIFSSSLRVDR